MAVPFADRQEAATSLLELAAELKAQKAHDTPGSCHRSFFWTRPFGVGACTRHVMSGRLRGQACAPLPTPGAAFPEWWPELRPNLPILPT